MRVFHALLAAALLGTSLAAIPHEGTGQGSQGAPAGRKEQKAWGIAGDSKGARRTIRIAMGDNMRFRPDHLQVMQGETVRFVVKNQGKLFHEMVIGTRKDLDEHAALMAKFPGMEHDEPYMAHVKPGAVGEIVWNFNRPGEFEFACLVPGHYPAGMVGKITVHVKERKS